MYNSVYWFGDHRVRVVIYTSYIGPRRSLILPMPRKSTHSRSDQQDLSSQFAAPELYRLKEYTVTDTIEWCLYPSKNGKEGVQINCVATRKQSAQDRQMGLDSFPLYNDPTGPAAPIYVQRVKVYSDKIIRYPYRYDDGPRKQVTPTSQSNLTRGIFKGYISTESGRVIRKRLEAWIKAVHVNADVNSTYRRPNHSGIVFATLTLPSKQIHGDNEIKRRVLMPFIQQLKRLNGVHEHFFSAEPQRNGNIHFHCLFDRYIPKDKLNDLWLTATDHLGYFGRYVEQTGETTAPATKINECPRDMSLVKYVMKYVSKQPEIRCSLRPGSGGKVKRISYWTREEFKGGVAELEKHGYDLDGHDVERNLGRWYGWYERRPIEGRSWGMSKGISKLDVYSTEATYRVQDLLTIAEWSPDVRVVEVDHAEIFLMNTYDFMQKHDIVMLQDYRRYYLSIYQQLYHPPDIEQVADPPMIDINRSVAPVDRVGKQLRIAV